jgi:hypothetical protein
MTNIVPDAQLEFNLGDDEKEAVVEVSGHEPEENEVSDNRVTTSSQPEQEETVRQKQHSDELDNVSENVQRRIAKLTAKMREAERQREAALDYARNVQAKAQDLEQRLVVTDNSRLSETKSRLETQTATLKAIIRRAREEGDIDTETEAQERLLQLSLDQRQVNDWLSQQEQQAAYQQQQQYVQPQQQQAPQRPTPSRKAEDWASSNEWFGKDRTMTYAAWAIHADLIEKEGFDPESDEYYTELDNRLRDEFPNRFRTASEPQQRQRQNVPAVAPATRSSGVGSARRSVRLRPSQVAIAKKLGVPLEEYAKYVKE